MLQIINFCVRKVDLRKYLLNAVSGICVLMMLAAVAHSQTSSPASWLYPDGNLQATRFINHKSFPQEVTAFSVKWSTPLISGDVRPLIGNLATNEPLPGFTFAPNEIAAVMGDEIIIISGTGALINKSGFPGYVTGIKGISCLIDTLSQVYTATNANLVMALEGIETFNPLDKDSLAFAYIFGYDIISDSTKPLKRLAVNLRPFNPNIFASVKPIFGRRLDGKFIVYATINMTQPKVPDPNQIDPPFFRGLAQFHEGVNTSTFPLPDIQDQITNRAYLGPEVNTGQPSMFLSPNGGARFLLPTYPTPATVNPAFDDLLISTLLNGQYFETFANYASLVGLDVNNARVTPSFIPFEVVPDDGTRPNLRPYYVDITDGWTGQRGFILVAEEYNGIDGSDGVPKLHLHNANGFPLTDYFAGSDNNPHFRGDTNHYWSVAIGNVDGNAANTWPDYYPNNPGNELIITQTTRDFAHPASRLFVMRYYTGAPIKKPTPSGEELFPFDTIFSARINGWIAAVNDLDNGQDGKDELILADGGKLMVLRVRDYTDTRFRLGHPFDTLYSHHFFNQVISHVAVADLEGDGRNDIIVTTYDSTYVIGSIIPNTLTIITPKDPDIHKTEFCLGDTVEVKWRNSIRSQREVRIDFEEYIGGLPTGNFIPLSDKYDNNNDSLVFRFVADETFAGKQGVVIVEGLTAPEMLRDISALLSFSKPVLYADMPAKAFYYFGEKIELGGRADCSDSVFAEFHTGDTVWTFAGRDTLHADGSYLFTLDINCIPKIFLCSRENQDTTITLRVITSRGKFSDTSGVFTITLRPAIIPIKYDTLTSADPTRKFYWKQIDFPKDIPCQQISVSVSPDGVSFSQIGIARLSDEYFEWDVPLNIPDDVVFRFCCINSCAGIDTLISGVTPKFIDIIAPNPFNPIVQQLSIVYKVNEETNVTIKILDQNNKIVAIPVKNAPRLPGIAYGDSWDGIREDGAYVANGIYYISLELSNGKREIYPLYIRK